MKCIACSFDAEETARFCSRCGAALGGAALAVPAVLGAAPPGSLKGRRYGQVTAPELRQVTIMFCDMIRSTSLSEKLDPEAYGDLIVQVRRACVEAVQHWHGFVTRYLGDGLLICFGYPHADESDPLRAVCAGIEVAAAVRQLNHSILIPKALHPAPDLAVRIGIHTGVAVAGDLGDGAALEHDGLLGRTPNVAARVQEYAAPGTVVISADTRSLIGTRFQCRSMGRIAMKGLAEPLELFEVLPQATTSCVLRRPVRLDIGFYGRSNELGILKASWQDARSNAGQAILITGEAGIGKSRLVQAFCGAISKGSFRPISAECSPYSETSPLLPILNMLKREWALGNLLPRAAVLSRIAQCLQADAPHLTGYAPLVADLFSTTPADYCGAPAMEPARRREMALTAVAGWIASVSARVPVVVTIEDLHWADHSTLSFIALILKQLPAARLLLLLTSRPDFSVLWETSPCLHDMALDRFDIDQSLRLIADVVGDRPLPEDVVRRIAERADGVPLFLEELTRAVLESRTAEDGAAENGNETGGQTMDRSPAGIPATLRDSLMARLDRLGPAKTVAQFASVIGRTFSRELLDECAAASRTEIDTALSGLLDAGLISLQTVDRETTYVFRHALIQETAYSSLLRRHRRLFHGRVGDALDRCYPGIVREQPELLARHYELAERHEPAVDAWLRAGQLATMRSSNMEAIIHLRHALAILDAADIPDWPRREAQRLAVVLAQVAPLIGIHGWADPKLSDTYRTAFSLCERIGTARQLFDVLRGMMNVHLLRGELESGRQIAHRLHGMADEADGADLYIEAYRAQGVCSFLSGEFDRALAWLDRTLAIYDPLHHDRHTYLYGANPAVVAMSWRSWCLSLLGRSGQAREAVAAAIRTAQSCGHPFSVAYALCFATSVAQHEQSPEEALHWAANAIALAEEHNYPYWLAWSRMVQGWALGRLGQGERGAAVLREGLAGYRATRARMIEPCGLTMLAETLWNAGCRHEARNVLLEASELVAETRLRFHAAEIERLGRVMAEYEDERSVAGDWPKVAGSMAMVAPADSSISYIDVALSVKAG